MEGRKGWRTWIAALLTDWHDITYEKDSKITEGHIQYSQATHHWMKKITI